jgi:hypothetical protein
MRKMMMMKKKKQFGVRVLSTNYMLEFVYGHWHPKFGGQVVCMYYIYNGHIRKWAKKGNMQQNYTCFIFSY